MSNAQVIKSTIKIKLHTEHLNTNTRFKETWALLQSKSYNLVGGAAHTTLQFCYRNTEMTRKQIHLHTYTHTEGPEGVVALSMVIAWSGILVKHSQENCLTLC